MSNHSRSDPPGPEPAAPQQERVCVWTLDADYDGDSWDTACGERFVFIEGTPSQNQMRFCGYCGGKLVERVPPEVRDDAEA